MTDHDPERPEMSDRLEKWVTGIVVASCAFFVFAQLNPSLIFEDTTPTGGDMGAHVWGPAFLRDELIPNLRLTGWTPDWYSGFPAFHFYFVIPALAIVILDVGLSPFISLPILVVLLVAAFTTAAQGQQRRAIQIGIAAAVLAPFIVSLPYNVAFKLVSVSGVVMFPVAAWALGHLSALRFPGPAILSIASLAFAFDRSFNIYGGNIASTLAGEFAASISLALSLVALGLVIRGTRTNEGLVWAGVMIALTGLSHLLPVFWLLLVVALLMVIRVVQRKFSAFPWLLGAGTLGGLVSAFWVLPFAARSDFLNDMGWERIEIIHSPLITRSNLNPSEVLSDYPPLPVLLTIAFVGAVLSIIRRVELGPLLLMSAIATGAAFAWFPDGRLWNARILPFYYLSVTLLAGLGVALLVNELARSSFVLRIAALCSASLLLVPSEIRGAVVWPEPGGDGDTPTIESLGDLGNILTDYLPGAAGYAVRVLAILVVLAVIGTEIPRQMQRLLNNVEVVSAIAAVAVLIVSPARDLDSLGVRGVQLFWTIAFVLSVAVLSAVVMSVFVRSIASPEPVEGADGEFTTEPKRARGLLGALSRHFDSDVDSGTLAAPVVAAATVFVLLGLALNTIGGLSETDEGRIWSLAGFDITSTDNSFVGGWSAWNYSGMQAKGINTAGLGDVGQGGFEEYQLIQRTMLGVGEEIGCGRAMWEFAPELNRYGTTMAMMLLPMWSDGCIGSMEGLFFEATPTVPYHFLLQTDLSAARRTIGDQSVGGPSQAMRDLPYGTFDINRGVERLNELGVRYYLAFSPSTIAEARNHRGLTEVASAAPWVVFETTSQLVVPLTAEPVVIDGLGDSQHEWLDVGVEWFENPDAARPATSGPESWQRVDAEQVRSRYLSEDGGRVSSIGVEDPTLAALLPETAIDTPTIVSNTLAETDRISFTVDQIGTPILIKSSFFPAWEARGAEGPFRVAPNFMVVVPTETTVELVFARTTVDYLALLLTGFGLVSIVALGVVRPGRDRSPKTDLLAPGPLVSDTNMLDDSVSEPELVSV